jgi:hypothetical protein
MRMSCPCVLDNEKLFEPFFGGWGRALVLPRVIMGESVTGIGPGIVTFAPFHRLPRPRSSFSGGSRQLRFSAWRNIVFVRSLFSQLSTVTLADTTIQIAK